VKIQQAIPKDGQTPHQALLLRTMLDAWEAVCAPFGGLASDMQLAAEVIETAEPVHRRDGRMTLTNHYAEGYAVQELRIWLAHTLRILAPAVHAVWRVESSRAMVCTDGEPLRLARYQAGQISGERARIVTLLRVGHAEGRTLADLIERIERGEP
jgi:hypothetical protein